MTTLAEFLLARIAEDERIARTALGETSGQWESWNHRAHGEGLRDLAVDNVRIAELPDTIDEHVCQHSPSRVLAECRAKRRIVGFVTEHHEWDEPYLLAMLALPHADHPDFREEWRPSAGA